MDPDRLSDEALIETLDVGSAGRTFGEFYGRHQTLIVAFHQRRVRDPEVAADLAAETFAQALASRHRFVSEGAGSGVRWLYGIAGNVLRRSVRRSVVEQRKIQRLRLDRPVLDDEQLTAVEEAGSESAVMRALEALPPGQRDVVRAFVLDEHSYDAMATQLYLKPAAVQKRVSRGLAALRRDLEKESS